jgi:hypothetical protein
MGKYLMNRLRTISVKDIAFYERDVNLRMPFRFGVVTLREAPQLFIKLTLEDENGKRSQGYSAEVLAPKWFDKNPELTNEDNFQQLREAAKSAAQLYLADQPKSPFALYIDNYKAQSQVANDQRLIASFGQAIIDRAVIDALCRMDAISFYQAIQENRVGMWSTEMTPDLHDFNFDLFLAGLKPANAIYVRHTVGLLDPLSSNPEPVLDGLPETLSDVIDFYGNSYFKIKVGGEIDTDVRRLTEIAAVLDQKAGDYRLSLDGNEQYDGAEAFLAFFEAMENEPSLKSFCERILFIEQPIARATALSKNISAISNKRPVIIDESDDSLDTFPRAMEQHYHGVSSKSCKGIYKSIINLARCLKAGEEYFLSAEDLTMQAGLGVQQDLALVSLLGLTHVERNGHHYVNGFSNTGKTEQLKFLEAHSGLYHEQDGVVRLKITNGKLDLSSLDCIGFASTALPELSRMRLV